MKRGFLPERDAAVWGAAAILSAIVELGVQCLTPVDSAERQKKER